MFFMHIPKHAGPWWEVFSFLKRMGGGYFEPHLFLILLSTPIPCRRVVRPPFNARVLPWNSMRHPTIPRLFHPNLTASRSVLTSRCHDQNGAARGSYQNIQTLLAEKAPCVRGWGWLDRTPTHPHPHTPHPRQLLRS